MASKASGISGLIENIYQAVKLLAASNLMTRLSQLAEKTLIILGFFISCISLILIILGLWSLISVEQFAYGISSGIRVLASCAIIGCLLSAIGYGIGDYFNHESKE